MHRLTRPQLELINRRTLGYPLPIAEKDYFLALALEAIYDSHLAKTLIFKGGTAIHHCYIDQKRFSEDLDFTSLDADISLGDLLPVLEKGGIFRVSKSFESEFTVKIERLQYQGLLGQPGNIKVEVDRHQKVVLPGVSKPYRNVWNLDIEVSTMDVLEICAEKIRAVSQRARYRDFYDLYFLLNEQKIEFEAAIAVLKKKEMRTPVIAANIPKNWLVAKEQMERNLSSIYCAEEVENQFIEEMIFRLRFEDLK